MFLSRKKISSKACCAEGTRKTSLVLVRGPYPLTRPQHNCIIVFPWCRLLPLRGIFLPESTGPPRMRFRSDLGLHPNG